MSAKEDADRIKKLEALKRKIAQDQLARKAEEQRIRDERRLAKKYGKR
jgi:hypothetical protein